VIVINITNIDIYFIISTIVFIVFQLYGIKHYRKNENNSLFDYWSIGHFLMHNFIYSFMYLIFGVKIAFIISISFALVWELYEITMNKYKHIQYYNEHLKNRATDIIFGILGTMFSYYMIMNL
jgi:hypothetical protein